MKRSQMNCPACLNHDKSRAEGSVLCKLTPDTKRKGTSDWCASGIWVREDGERIRWGEWDIDDIMSFFGPALLPTPGESYSFLGKTYKIAAVIEQTNYAPVSGLDLTRTVILDLMGGSKETRVVDWDKWALMVASDELRKVNPMSTPIKIPIRDPLSKK